MMGRRRIAVALVFAACGAAQRPKPASDPVLDAARLLLRRGTASELSALPLAEREEAIYGTLYNTIDGTKPRTIDQAEYDRRLGQHTERAETRGPWHLRWGVGDSADLSMDARRLYLDVVPDHAAAAVDGIADELDRRGVRRYSLKVLSALDTFDIPVPLVLYAEAPDYLVARDVAIAWVRAHPEAMWPESPPLTKPLVPGLSAADEIGSVGPEGVAGNSFGGAMAHLFALALEGAPPDLDAPALATRMRDRLREAGFDPARPWLRPGHSVDDL